MKTHKFTIVLVYIGLTVCGSLFGQHTIGNTSIELGGNSGWQIAEIKSGITELHNIRRHPVLALSAAGNPETSPSHADLSISFDENVISGYKDTSGRYKVTASGIESVDRAFARSGAGAALFNNQGHVRVLPETREALFWQGNAIMDFTIEFWLYPLNMENGEEILSWNSVVRNNITQKINCTVSKNRLSWSFLNFFTWIDTENSRQSFIDMELSCRTVVNPKKWSHHLIRFDSSTGLLEYIVNGQSEAIAYAASTGREPLQANGMIYSPVTGSDGFFTLGARFTGMMDELKIYGAFKDRSSYQKYPSSGGRMETGAIDLGHNNSGVLTVEATGGRVSLTGKTVNNEFRSNGRMWFSCDAEMNFFIRSNDNPYLLPSSPYYPFTPGAELKDARGRYVQIAVDFYPSADGETSPYLETLKIVYLPGEPPLPPRSFTAVAADGGVMLSWKASPDLNTSGYLIYYSPVRGELFGTDALQGASPIRVGNRTSFFVEGLKNGTLYYFRIAAYDEYSTGEFSAEVTARPLAGLSLSAAFKQ